MLFSNAGVDMVSAELCKTSDRFVALAPEWDALLPCSEINDIFFTHEWLTTWWQHYGRTAHLFVILIREGKDLVGIAPLILEKRKIMGLTANFLTNIGKQQSDLSGFILLKERPDILRAILQTLQEQRERWEVFSLHDVPRHLFAAELNNIHTIFDASARVLPCEHYYIDTHGSWSDYYSALSKNLRKDLHKKQNRLERLGAVRIKRYQGKEVDPNQIETIFQIQGHSYRPGLFSCSDDRDFHRALARIAAEKGWLDLTFLTLDDNPIAYRYGFNYAHKYEDWITGFDNRYFPYSVGKTLLLHLLQQCFGDNVHEFQFLRGEEAYKTVWQVQSSEFYHQMVWARDKLMRLTQIALPEWRSRMRKKLEEVKTFKPVVERYEKMADKF
ncbi:MAG TPA: GNAT family N-acetyltransferase [bacterium]|nr:GNAT family N-acetyltransferase [bacterium]HPG45173.1 GNAT family N-acetyltransferase [bacterium]